MVNLINPCAIHFHFAILLSGEWREWFALAGVKENPFSGRVLCGIFIGLGAFLSLLSASSAEAAMRRVTCKLEKITPAFGQKRERILEPWTVEFELDEKLGRGSVIDPLVKREYGRPIAMKVGRRELRRYIAGQDSVDIHSLNMQSKATEPLMLEWDVFLSVNASRLRHSHLVFSARYVPARQMISISVEAGNHAVSELATGKCREG